MLKKMKNSLIILILLFALGSIWGSGPVINKFAISRGVSPIGYSFWQFIGPAIVLSIIAKLQGNLIFSKKHLPYYTICGLVGCVIPSVILHTCAPHLPSGIMPIIINLVPLLVYPLALLTKQETFKISRLLGIIIGMIGILSLLIPKSSLPGSNMLPWAILSLVTPLCFAITALFINPYKPKNTPSISLASGMLISASILITPILLFTSSYYPITFPLNYADYAILIRICMHSCGHVIFFTIIRQAGAVYYSLVCGIVILNGLFWGYVVFNEELNSLKLFSACTILLAITIMNFSQAKVKHG
jgi:drug/metabolite transporter (DMT)-like permease